MDHHVSMFSQPGHTQAYEMEWASTSRKRSRDPALVVVKKKKRRTGGKNRKTSKLIIRSVGQIVPDKLVTSLTYCSTSQYTPGVSAEDRVFNINSIFDPDRTGTGHQPMGRDQLVAFYNRYRVIDCSWRVDVMPQAGVGSILSVLVPNNETSSLASSSETAMETPYAQYKWSEGYLATSVASDLRHIRQGGKMHLAKLYGVSDATFYGDDRYAAEFGSNPTESACLHVCTFNSDGNTLVYNMCIKLIYTVEFFDRIQLAAS